MDESATSIESDYSADELGQYRSLETLTILAFALGLLSPLVLISPLLVFVPFAAAGAGCLSLLKIRAAEGNLTGSRFAYCGVALAIIFGVATLARAQITHVFYQQQIHAVVEPWLENVCQARYGEALNLMSPPAVTKLRAQASALSEVMFFQKRLTAQELALDISLRLLTGMAESKKIPAVVVVHFEQMDSQVTDYSDGKRADCIYEIANNRGEKIRMAIKLVRLSNASQAPHWRIDQWQLVQD